MRLAFEIVIGQLLHGIEDHALDLVLQQVFFPRGVFFLRQHFLEYQHFGEDAGGFRYRRGHFGQEQAARLFRQHLMHAMAQLMAERDQ